MNHIKTILLFLVFINYYNLASQSNFNSLGESVVSVENKTSKSYSFNFVLRSRYFLYQPETFNYKQQQVDAFHFSNFKLKQSYKLSLGVYYRNRDWFDSGHDELRFLEQITYSKKRAIAKHSHRFRAEQRIINSKTIYRQRYKFEINTPLNTNTVKSYLITAIEGLLSLNKTIKPETDLRFTAIVGWQISEDLKLQTGLEHRFEAFNLAAKNNLFVLSSAVIKI
ncbi:hypothetical protein GCM10022291_14760 [Postechiella marina]|uniref:DUF2490 domain-containing protein n=1 Tax=Postechiella marina TaxID=943941 RepID=A0ABP8C6S3_9FLAO